MLAARQQCRIIFGAHPLSLRMMPGTQSHRSVATNRVSPVPAHDSDTSASGEVEINYRSGGNKRRRTGLRPLNPLQHRHMATSCKVYERSNNPMHRYRRGQLAAMEVQRFQHTCEPLIGKQSFRRLVKKILLAVKTDAQVYVSACDALQVSIFYS